MWYLLFARVVVVFRAVDGCDFYKFKLQHFYNLFENVSVTFNNSNINFLILLISCYYLNKSKSGSSAGWSTVPTVASNLYLSTYLDYTFFYYEKV